MTTQNGSYGLQVIGGVDTALPAQVERVVPGECVDKQTDRHSGDIHITDT